MRTKHIISYFFICIFLLLAEFLLLVASASIPSDAIKENVTKSAEYLCEKPVFFNMIEQDASSRIDRYADSILLNIAYSYDCDKPVNSVIKSAYYHNETQNENTNLLHCVTYDEKPTYDYMRYWHGSLIIIRPLLVAFTLPQIYVLNIVILFLLLVAASFIIKKEYGTGTCVGFVIAAIMTSVWYVPFSLEYMPTFVIAFTCVPFVIITERKFPSKSPYLFLILGSLTAFTDFLTTETLTLLLPLTLFMLNKKKKPIVYCIQSGICWLSSYGFTWSFKWILYSLLINDNGFSDAIRQSVYRTGGKAFGNIGQQMIVAPVRNLSCLFPFSLLSETSGYFVIVASLIVILSVYFVVKKQNNMPTYVTAIFLLGLIPYLRYVFLSNHAYLHYFFTFRAQFVSVFCLFLAFMYGTDTEFLKNELKKRKTKNKKKRR